MATALPNARLTNLLIALTCAGLMAYALYAQEVLGLAPCALCITQRIFVILVGVIALVACVHNPQALGRRIYAGLGSLAAIGGIVFAGRHVWLQSLPEDQAPACGPGFNYIFDTFPLMEALEVLMRGDGNCAKTVWSFLGLSMPTWVLIAFIGLLLVNLWQLFRHR